MDIKTFILEIWDLIKKEKWIIITSTVLMAILASGLLFIQRHDFKSDSANPELNTTPAVFHAFIEQEYEGAFTNSYLLEMLFTQSDVVNEIENLTGVSISPVLEEFAEENEVIYTPTDPINVERNRSSNLMEMTFNIGDNTENLSVAHAYADWVTENELDFFNDKEVFIIYEPSQAEGEEMAMASTGISTTRLIIQAVIGSIFGIVLGMGIAILKALLSDKITYGFTYGWSPDEIYVKELKNETNKKVAYDILSSNMDSTVIVSETELEETLIHEVERLDNKNTYLIRSISDLPLDKKVKEFVFVIIRNKTTKAWYHAQRRNLRLHPEARVKIIEK